MFFSRGPGQTMRSLLEKLSFKQTAIGVADSDVSISTCGTGTKLYAWVRFHVFKVLHLLSFSVFNEFVWLN
jgi:hypothetical protein